MSGPRIKKSSPGGAENVDVAVKVMELVGEMAPPPLGKSDTFLPPGSGTPALPRWVPPYRRVWSASAVFGWQAQLPSAGGLNICIIIYTLRIWFALRFYRHVDDQLLETMLSSGLKPYGERSQTSYKDITNFRGNCIEGLLGYIAKFIE